MTSLRTSALVGAAALTLLGTGCKNPCEKLAERICEPAQRDLAECEGIPADSKDPAAAAAACDRMKAVVLSCKELPEKAKSAAEEDLAACRADLELIRALERQMQ